MSKSEFDFIVIGGGSAGYSGAAMAAGLGLRTAVIEGGDEVGGLCILRGCMPSKTFLESAHRAETVRRASEFGVRAEFLGADGAAIRARKRRLIAEFAGYRKEQLQHGKFTFIRGNAAFESASTILVRKLDGGEERLEGGAFLIATGSKIDWVDIPGLKEVGALSSDDVLESELAPKSVIVLGGGPTALEFASYYAGIGSEVTLIQRSAQLLKEMDADVAHAISAALGRRGIRVMVDTQLLRMERAGGLKRVWFEQLGKECYIEAEEIVYALGRKPNTESIGLGLAGVQTARNGGVSTNSAQQSSVPNIFAAGDVCGPYEVVHIAIQQAEIAARNAAHLLRDSGHTLEQIDHSLKLFAVFTQPEVAAVGLSLREALDVGLDVVEALYPFEDHGKAIVRGETDGFVKLIAARGTGKIVGAAVVGPDASELIHEIVVAMAFGATAAQLARIPHYHPTLSEIWTYPAEALAMA